MDKLCSTKLAKGEVQQYGRWMKALMPRRGVEEERPSWSGSRSAVSSGRSSGYGFGDRSRPSGSDRLSWRKDGDGYKKSGNSGDKENNEASQVVAADASNKEKGGAARTGLDGMGKEVEQDDHNKTVSGVKPAVIDPSVHDSSKINNKKEGKGSGNNGSRGKGAKKEDGQRGFHRRSREVAGSDVKLGVEVGGKRDIVELEVDEQEDGMHKKARKGEGEQVNDSNQTNEAGLPEQPCATQ